MESIEYTYQLTVKFRGIFFQSVQSIITLYHAKQRD